MTEAVEQERMSMVRKKTTEEVVASFREKWGDRWDYSQVVYVKALEPVTIICPEHGSFDQLTNNHLRGHIGCGECSGKGIPTTEEYLSKAREVWGDRWDYSQSIYANNHTPLTFVCPEHGEFTQHPRSHLKGHVGCPQCNSWQITPEMFRERASELYGNMYRYDKSDIQGMREKITITCPDHGDFVQVADSHLRGFLGCSSCLEWGTSKSEEALLSFVKSLDLEVQHRVRGLLPTPNLELDVYVPSRKLAIEFNGVYYHSSKFNKDPQRHVRKLREAGRAGIRLVQVWEDDWNLRQDIVKEHIRQVLGASTLPKIAARKTSVVELSYIQSKEFLDRYHIQGASNGSHYLGLTYRGDLCAVAVFKRRGEDLELTRYATSANVQGGHSKLVSFVEKNLSYRNLVTFADLTFSNGDLYRTTGWLQGETIPPDYSYLVRGRREHKFNYRIKRFKEDPNLLYMGGATESQLAELNNLARVYDAGKIRFHKPRPDSVTV